MKIGKQTGSFICMVGWSTLFFGYVYVAIFILAIGFTIVLTDKSTYKRK